MTGGVLSLLASHGRLSCYSKGKKLGPSEMTVIMLTTVPPKA